MRAPEWTRFARGAIAPRMSSKGSTLGIRTLALLWLTAMGSPVHAGDRGYRPPLSAVLGGLAGAALPSVEKLVETMGDEDSAVRDRAERALAPRVADHLTELRALLAVETRPEVSLRLDSLLKPFAPKDYGDWEELVDDVTRFVVDHEEIKRLRGVLDFVLDAFDERGLRAFTQAWNAAKRKDECTRLLGPMLQNAGLRARLVDGEYVFALGKRTFSLAAGEYNPFELAAADQWRFPLSVGKLLRARFGARRERIRAPDGRSLEDAFHPLNIRFFVSADPGDRYYWVQLCWVSRFGNGMYGDGDRQTPAREWLWRENAVPKDKLPAAPATPRFVYVRSGSRHAGTDFSKPPGDGQ